ncbi:hypothetical protein Sjap_018019 [Stephania japonica]|uniref:Uncharacterized protein n=1 Tax=Stephania japonica TaxID=461633 RepID=A0AAP0NKM7_9MAGN
MIGAETKLEVGDELDQSNVDTWRTEWRANSCDFLRRSGSSCGCVSRGRSTSWREETAEWTTWLAWIGADVATLMMWSALVMRLGESPSDTFGPRQQAEEARKINLIRHSEDAVSGAVESNSPRTGVHENTTLSVVRNCSRQRHQWRHA